MQKPKLLQMHVRPLLFIFLGLNGTALAQSPIVLSNSNMPGNNDTLRYTNVNPASLGSFTQTGTNFVWNYHNLVSLSEGLRSFKNALQTPYAFYFLALNEYGEKVADTLGAGPLTITNYYNYYRKQTSPSNAFVADGVGMTFSSVPVPSYYSDKDELYKFPMTYPQYDSTTFKFSTISNSLLPISYSKAGYRVTRVDGWGKVITPYDTADCLRLVTTQYANDTIKTTIGPVTIPIGFPNYVRSYQWMSLNSKIPFLEVSGSLINDNFTVTTVRYRGYQRGTTGNPVSVLENNDPSPVLVFPNPVYDRLYFQGSANLESLSYEITDINARVLLSGTLFAAEMKNGIPVSGLAPGVYGLRFGKTGTVQRFVRE